MLKTCDKSHYLLIRNLLLFIPLLLFPKALYQYLFQDLWPESCNLMSFIVNTFSMNSHFPTYLIMV